MRSRPTYSEDFKADAVDLLKRTNRSLAEVAQDLGVSKVSLRTWYNQGAMTKKKKSNAVAVSPLVSAPESETPEQTIKRLERELRAANRRIDELETDRAILKKAAAFFAKESE